MTYKVIYMNLFISFLVFDLINILILPIGIALERLVNYLFNYLNGDWDLFFIITCLMVIPSLILIFS